MISPPHGFLNFTYTRAEERPYYTTEIFFRILADSFFRSSSPFTLNFRKFMFHHVSFLKVVVIFVFSHVEPLFFFFFFTMSLLLVGWLLVWLLVVVVVGCLACCRPRCGANASFA